MHGATVIPSMAESRAIRAIKFLYAHPLEFHLPLTNFLTIQLRHQFAVFLCCGTVSSSSISDKVFTKENVWIQPVIDSLYKIFSPSLPWETPARWWRAWPMISAG